MASLFDKLLRLQSRHTDRTPLEDYFTELFAYLLQDAPDILDAFLRRFQLTHLPGLTFASVQTQVGHERLAGHNMDSRPDLVLQVESTTGRGLVFIESKISSKESWTQLQRYAEHLAAQADLEERVLVYVTRDYDPKKEALITANVATSSVRFVQLRWYAVYFFLKKGYSQHWLAREVCRFMEKNRMAQDLQFNPIDLLALTNFRRAESMMSQSLKEAVLKRLQKFGGSGIKMEVAMQQYEQQGRYILMAHQRDSMWVGVGYFMPADDPYGYPLVGIMLEINALRCSQRVEVMAAMDEVARTQPGRWAPVKQTTDNKYPQIRYLRPVHDFLHGEDHQGLIRQHLIECIDVLDAIRKQFPALPWLQASEVRGASADEPTPVQTEECEEEIA